MPEFAQAHEPVRPPRVLFVSHETTLSGAPIQLVHLVRWLKKAGWEVAVVAPDEGPISEMLARDGIVTVMESLVQPVIPAGLALPLKPTFA